MIEIVDLSKSYGKKTALRNVSFVVPNGAITGFVGPNGAGKSSLIKITAGLIDPCSGAVLIDERPISEHGQPWGTLGVCLSPDGMPNYMTGRRMLEYACRTQGINVHRVSEILDQTGLSSVSGKRLGKYSAGMRQRLAVGLAILARPANLVLDEPINGLDITGVRWLRGILVDLASRGTAILLSSHILSELTLTASTIVMLSHGEVVREGTLESIREETGNSGIRVDSQDRDSLEAALHKHGMSYYRQDNGMLVSSTSPDAVFRVIRAEKLTISHLSVEHGSLEEAFVDATTAEYEGR